MIYLQAPEGVGAPHSHSFDLVSDQKDSPGLLISPTLCVGPISFFDPRTGDAWYNGQMAQGPMTQNLKKPPQPGSKFSPPFHHPYVVSPRKGDLLIFPGYVNHAVGPGTNT